MAVFTSQTFDHIEVGINWLLVSRLIKRILRGKSSFSTSIKVLGIYIGAMILLQDI